MWDWMERVICQREMVMVAQRCAEFREERGMNRSWLDVLFVFVVCSWYSELSTFANAAMK